MPSETAVKTRVELYPLLAGIAAATDLVSPVLVNHHRRVAFVAAALGSNLGLNQEELRRLILAAAVHDIGGLTVGTRLEAFEFEVATPARHTLPGASLLAGFAPFAELARIVRFHHLYWQHGRGGAEEGEEVPRLSHIIHLADRVAVQIDPTREILAQQREIVARIKAGSGEMFAPDQVEAFLELAGREAFWLDLTSPGVGAILEQRFPLAALEFDRGQLLALAEMFRRLIDFRSRFTATHSSGVAAVASALAARSGFMPADPDRIMIAGWLHDIGKLVVPAEILEKRQGLASGDLAIIYKHPYYTGEILRPIPGFEDIGQWGSLHHERLDGSGYPFRMKGEEIPQGARILAVADTFTALMEDRPYRCGISAAGTERIMRDMVEYHRLDRDFVGLVHENISEINDRRHEAQLAADQAHLRFLEECRLLAGSSEVGDRCPVSSRGQA
ncbi:HD domain-containing phosphohydrolase [Desulfurivibrio sp. D14AmB]|uniref:HD domain-containing phosphohydrolase n=1 Tax=Desulfurivibrio sp. D14AmB TaxID=3374370 RepID=UPI00376F07D2